MRKWFPLITLALFLSGCLDQEKEREEQSMIVQDTISDQGKKLLDIDKDKDGCLSTAGYTWSDLKNDCVRVFDIGVRLEPHYNPSNEDFNKSLFLLFSDDGNKVEAFLPMAEEPILLTRSKEKEPWVYEEYQLIYENFYRFRKGNRTLFSGEGQIGPKVIGSYKKED